MQSQNTVFYPIPKPPSFYDSSLNAVGIDLGTTRCSVAVNKKEKIDVIAVDNNGERPLPSFVGYDERYIKCGSVVVKRLRNYSEHIVFDVKRLIGKSYNSVETDSSWPFSIIQEGKGIKIKTKNYLKKDLYLTPEEVSAVLLKEMKIAAEATKSESLSETVITVPAGFTQKQTDATMEAALIAGWDTIHVLPEPIAACFTYINEEEIPSNSKILVFDLGGGTLDICVVEINNLNLQVLGSFGDQYLGGRNFDTLLMNHFASILSKTYGIDVQNNDTKKYKLLLLCQEIKHTLQIDETVTLHVDDFDTSLEKEVVEIDKDEFKKLSREILLRIDSQIQDTLAALNLSSNEIKYVLHAGGGCRMLIIRELLETIFPNAQHRCNVNPDWVVANGASLYCCLLKTQYSSTVLKHNLKED